MTGKWLINQEYKEDIISGGSRPSYKWGRGGEGRGTGHKDPEIRGGPDLKKKFFRPLELQYGLKIRGAGLPGPFPGYGTEHCFELCYAALKGFQENAPKPHPRHCIDAEMKYYCRYTLHGTSLDWPESEEGVNFFAVSRKGTSTVVTYLVVIFDKL